MTHSKPVNATMQTKPRHRVVFAEEQAIVKGVKTKLTLKDEVKIVFIKAKSISYALRPAVEAGLDQLEKREILTKVTTSKWASPIIPLVKKMSGAVRICRHNKITVNPCLRVNQ